MAAGVSSLAKVESAGFGEALLIFENNKWLFDGPWQDDVDNMIASYLTKQAALEKAKAEAYAKKQAAKEKAYKELVEERISNYQIWECEGCGTRQGLTAVTYEEDPYILKGDRQLHWLCKGCSAKGNADEVGK